MAKRHKQRKKGGRSPVVPKGRWRLLLVAVGVVALLGSLAALFGVETATEPTGLGAVERGDVILLERLSPRFLDLRAGQVVLLRSRSENAGNGGVHEVLATGGDEVVWRGGTLTVAGVEAPLRQPFADPVMSAEKGRKGQRLSGATAALWQGASNALDAGDAKLPSGLAIPSSPYVVPRHHLLVIRRTGVHLTTQMVPQGDVVAVGCAVLASTSGVDSGDNDIPRVLGR